ncbi:hypothetical protein ACB092_11G169700 [Castanea dentata]
MGNQSPRESDSIIKCKFQHNLYKSSGDYGVVQYGPNESLESHLSIDNHQCSNRVLAGIRPSMANMAKPMVDIPLKKTHTSKEKFLHLENNAPLLSFAKFMQINTSSQHNEVKDDGGGTNDVKMAGESPSKKANPSLLSHEDQ